MTIIDKYNDKDNPKDGRDEQAGPAGPEFFIQIFMTMTNTMTMTMTKTAFDLFI